MTDIISTKTKVVRKSVSFRVRETTARDLEQLKQRVKSAGDSIEFRLDDVLDQELVKLIKKAHQQFDSLQSVT